MTLPADTPVALRAVTPDDANMLLIWANDPETRSFSFANHLIPWEEHLEWLRHRLARTPALFYIAEEDGVPVGTMRFDLETEGIAIVSITVAPEHRGRGIALRMLARGEAELQRCSPTPACIAAYIKEENQASASLFARAGFVRTGTAVVRGCRAYVMHKRLASR